MSSTTLKPGQSHKFTDHEGGTDLKVTGTTGQPFTTAVDNGLAQTHKVGASGNVFEVADGQSMTVANTGKADTLTVAFPAESVSKRK